MGWHGETYCLVGGYRAYGEVLLDTPAKVEAEKPIPRRAPKRKHSPENSDCVSPHPKSSDYSMVPGGGPHRILLAVSFGKEGNGLTA